MDIANLINTIIIVSLSVVAVVFVLVFTLYYIINRRRNKYIEDHQYNLTFLQIKLPASNEYEIAAAETMFAGLTSFRKTWWQRLLKGSYRISFEIIAKQEGIGFYVVTPDELAVLVEKQINASYPDAEIDIIDPKEIWDRGAYTSLMELKTSSTGYYPIQTYDKLKVDSLNPITSAMSKLGPNEVVALQYIIRPSDDNWRKAGQSFIYSVKAKNASEKPTNIDPEFLAGIDKKIKKPGFDVVIRAVAIADDEVHAQSHLHSLETAFEQFTDVTYNRFSVKHYKKSNQFLHDFIYRKFEVSDLFIPIFNYTLWRRTSTLNIEEMATIFHLPSKDIQTPNIIWLGARRSAAPTNVPEEGLFLGSSAFRGVTKEIRIKEEDRRRHMYIVGQTGTGKSQFLQALAMQDIQAGKGLALIDPHGSAVDYILQKIPEERIKDVILFDVSDIERPLGLNILEAKTEEQKNMLINAFIAMLYKIYDPNRTGMIGPKFERAVRNIMLTAMADPKATLIDVLRLIIDKNYHKEFLPKITDPLIKRYWVDEVANTSDYHKSETMGYFVSKFDRFVTERTMRNILGQSESAIDFSKMMAEKKIFLADLSKGKIGEENANFLGLILVPRILSAALGRATLLGKHDFPDFYLYVDEFQNFATPDFATILSEARKYKLNLTVANQFIGQLTDDIKNAVFGNVGTLAAFRVGVDDSDYLAKQFEPIFSASDLINNSVGNCYVRLLVDGHPTVPFSMHIDWDKEANDVSSKYSTLQSNPSVAQKIREHSRMTYGKDAKEIEEFIEKRAGFTEPPEPPEDKGFKSPFGSGRSPFSRSSTFPPLGSSFPPRSPSPFGQPQPLSEKYSFLKNRRATGTNPFAAPLPESKDATVQMQTKQKDVDTKDFDSTAGLHKDINELNFGDAL